MQCFALIMKTHVRVGFLRLGMRRLYYFEQQGYSELLLINNDSYSYYGL